jgi:hypothetical protein
MELSKDLSDSLDSSDSFDSLSSDFHFKVKAPKHANTENPPTHIKYIKVALLFLTISLSAIKKIQANIDCADFKIANASVVCLN